MNDNGAFNYLSLFTGGGGLDLGFQQVVRGARCVAALEIEAFARQVLVSRMEEGQLDPCPVYSDVAAFDGTRFRGLVDGVIGGSPCQDMSLAGARRGLGGPKSVLFYEMARIIGESRPEWVLFENVLGAKKYLPAIFEEFERIGYTGKGTIIRASDVGASHQRARIFVLARRVENADGERLGLWGGGFGSTAQPAESQDAGGLEHADGRRESTTSRSVELGNAADERLAGSAGEGLQPVESAEGRVELADAARDGRDERGSTTTTSREAGSDGAGEVIRFHCACGGTSFFRDLSELCSHCGEQRSGEVTYLSLADAQQQRIESGRGSWEDGEDSSIVELAGEAVADDDDERCEGERLGGVPLGGPPPHWDDADGRSSPQLADASDARLQGSEWPGASGEDPGAPRPVAQRSRPEWPPGPDGDWSGIDPRLFPAQSRIRRVAHGLAGGMDPALAAQDVWADRLRMLGNGVVPKQAAAAIRFLYAAITRSTI